MVPPLLFQAQEVVQDLVNAPKLKKAKNKRKKEKSHQFGYENLGPRSVRPGETRWDQEPVNSMVRKLLYAFDARFPDLSFF